MKELRIYASEPGFEEIQLLVTDIHQYSNPGMWWNLKDMDETERVVALKEALEKMEEQIS